MWIGDFVRCHTVVKLLKARFPNRPIDVLTSATTAPLVDYMPGIRQGIVSDLPRRRIKLSGQLALAKRLRALQYGSVFVMPRTWKSALAPFLAGIPERIGFAGEARFILVNDLRWGERRLARMIDRCVALALPKDAPAGNVWPSPELAIPAASALQWRARQGLSEHQPLVGLAPGSVAPARRWPVAHYAELARLLAADGVTVGVIGGPNETPLARELVGDGASGIRDFTGPDLREALFALKAAKAVISNDSGLLHVSAAIGSPTIGLFGPGDPYLSLPLNPLAAIVETSADLPCRPCGERVCPLGHHRCMTEIRADQVLALARRALTSPDRHPRPET